MGLRLSEFPDNGTVFIDANIFLYSAFDHPTFGRSCKDFLYRVQGKGISGFSSNFVLNEVFYNLMVAEIADITGIEVRNARRLFKKQPEIIDKLDKVWAEMELIKRFNITLLDSPVFPGFVELSRRYHLMATDAVHLAIMRLNGICNIATNDGDFERVEGITLWMP